MKEIYKDIYKFEIPLPKSALKEINIYVIKSEGRSLVIDTGYNNDESKKYMKENLAKIGLEIKDCDLFLTHLHADHTGLATFFEDNGSSVYTGKKEGALINDNTKDSYWEYFMTFPALYDMAGVLTLEDYIGHKFKLSHELNFIGLEIGEIFKVGDYEFEVLDLRGHTPWHIGLYEKNHKFLFGGDTVLDPITPNITFWGFEYGNILGLYINTLKKLMTVGIDVILSSHRAPISNPNKRISEIIYHHYLRFQEILDSMNCDRDDYTIREISSKITWRIRANSWEDFPIEQKWFAVGETMVHMVYLMEYGYVECKKVDGALKFKKIKSDIMEEYERYKKGEI